MSEETPFALFNFMGGPVAMNEQQFDQALRDAQVCNCRDTSTCLCCRAQHYYWESCEANRRDPVELARSLGLKSWRLLEERRKKLEGSLCSPTAT